MLGSRGCPYTCNYCPYLVNSKYRVRSPESIVEEIRYLVSRYGIRGISFRDPNLTFNNERARDFAELLLRHNLDIRWGMEARTDRLTPDLVDLLFRSGLRSIEIGVESSNHDLLRQSQRKAVAAAQQEAIVEHCHRLGIRVMPTTRSDCRTTRSRDPETIRYAKKLNTFAIQFTVTTPYPGTRFYESVKGSIFEKDWERFIGWTSVYRHQNISPDELHRLREYAYVSYHLRPRYVWRFLQSTLLHPLLFPDPSPAQP